MRAMTWTATMGMLLALAAGCTSGDGTAAGGDAAGAAAPTADGAAGPAPSRSPSPAPSVGKESRRPVIGRVWITPESDCDASTCVLAGAGSAVVHAEVSGARAVEVFLVPTGTGTSSLRRSLGVDRDGRDGWSVPWAYPDEPLLAHLLVQARGSGGTTEALPVKVVHDQPGTVRPAVDRVWTDPALRCAQGWCRLPAPSGTLTIVATVRGAHDVWFYIDTLNSEPYRLAAPTRDGDRWSVRWSWGHQYDARLRIVAANIAGAVTVVPFGFRQYHPTTPVA